MSLKSRSKASACSGIRSSPRSRDDAIVNRRSEVDLPGHRPPQTRPPQTPPRPRSRKASKVAFAKRWAVHLLLAGTLLASAKSPAPGGDPGLRLPRCPAGWRLDVVLRSPRLRHPSVVCCAPDGRVFVAEDPM